MDSAGLGFWVTIAPPWNLDKAVFVLIAGCVSSRYDTAAGKNGPADFRWRGEPTQLAQPSRGSAKGGQLMRGCGDERAHAGPRPGGRPAGVQRTHRPPSARAPAALLPDSRLGAGRGGHVAGDAGGGLAWPGALRRAGFRARVAVPHRDQPLSQRAARRPATAATASGRPSRAASAPPLRRADLA